MASKAMAHISEIEQLSGDILSEILIRVGQSSTAEEMAGVFVVSKTFRNRIEDRNVLRAISFRLMSPILAESYEPLLEIGGLVARCAKANNPDAQFILAKLLMIGASKLRKAKIGVAQDVLIDKATRLLHHFSAENTDITELVSLIRSFLSRVDFTGLHKMRRHLRDFVILYRMPGKKPRRQQFLICLDKFCLRNSPPPAFTLLPFIVIVRSFNELCITIHTIRQNMGCVEEQLLPVLDCMVDGNDIGCETFLKHMDFVEPTLMIQGQAGENVDNEEVSGFNSFVSRRVSKLRYELRQVMDYDTFFWDARQEVLASFDALFDVQQLE